MKSNENCENCGYFCDNYKLQSPYNMTISVPMYSRAGKYMGSQLRMATMENPKGTGICNNPESEMFECCIFKGGYCKNYCSKENKQETKAKKEKTGFDVFENYKCDGQLVFDLEGNITEEK